VFNNRHHDAIHIDIYCELLIVVEINKNLAIPKLNPLPLSHEQKKGNYREYFKEFKI